MRYAGILQNDIADSITGLTVSFWTQGCPHKCDGCHNPQTWDFNSGLEKPIEDIKRELKYLINQNNIIRNFSVLGGEPLCKENIVDIDDIISYIRYFYPNIDIYLWTGYTVEELSVMYGDSLTWHNIRCNIDYLIDGKFKDNKFKNDFILCGSSNQRIYHLKNGKIIEEIPNVQF